MTTVLALDIYQLLTGLVAVVVLVTSMCVHMSSAAFCSAGVFSVAASGIGCLNVMTITLTTICDEKDSDDSSTGNNTTTPMTNKTQPQQQQDDDNYEFFCRHKTFFLILTVVSSTLWLLTGILALQIARRPNTSRPFSTSRPQQPDDAETVASEESFREEQRQDDEEEEEQQRRDEEP